MNLDDLEAVDIPVGVDGGEGFSAETEWVARVHWDMSPERFVPVAVTLLNLSGAPVTPEQWRHVRPAEIIRAARDMVTTGALLGSLSSDPADREAAAILLELAEGQPERSGYGEDHYREVARVYRRAVTSGDKAPVQEVRRHFRTAYPDLKETTVKGWVRTAKHKGYITETARPSRSQPRNTKGGDQE